MMDSELHKAIKSGDLPSIKDLLHKGANINSLFGMRGTPLCAAIYEKQSHIVDYLLERTCDINAKDFDGEPPLCLAIRIELYDLALKLICEPACNVNKVDPVSGQKPIHIAVCKGNYDLVASLVKNSCDINGKDIKGNTALHHAIILKQNTIAEYLIKAGSDTYIADDQGHMAIHSCVSNKNTTILIFLLTCTNIKTTGNPNIGDFDCKYVNVKTKGFNDTALLLAIKNENLEAVCTLIKYNCDIETANSLDDTPLYLACKFNRTVIAFCLLEAGACPNTLSSEKNHFPIYTKFKKKAPIHESVSLGNLSLVKKLVEYGASINMQDSVGQTPLFSALQRNKPDIADYILDHNKENGLDAKVVTSNGKSLLFPVSSCTNPAYFARRLIELGCDVNHEANLDSEANTPLECAIDMACTPVVEVLLEQGARTDMFNHIGDTPLHICASEDTTGVAVSLIQWGADTNAKSKINGGSSDSSSNCSSGNSDSEIPHTPLSIALVTEHYSFAKLLILCGCNVDEKSKQYLDNMDSQEDLDDEDQSVIADILARAKNVLSLKMLCRCSIINSIKFNDVSLKECTKLPLPKDLISYIRFKDLDVYKYVPM